MILADKLYQLILMMLIFGFINSLFTRKNLNELAIFGIYFNNLITEFLFDRLADF